MRKTRISTADKNLRPWVRSSLTFLEIGQLLGVGDEPVGIDARNLLFPALVRIPTTLRFRKGKRGLANPSEKNNLASKNPELVKELSALLDKWYVPEGRQAGKFTPMTAGPKKKKKKKKN